MKLYWRIKINGRWTYTPVIFLDHEKDTIKELIDRYIILDPRNIVEDGENEVDVS